MMLFTNKRVLVTGASSGIGEAAAREFARLGAEVVLAAENAESLCAVRESIVEAGGRATSIVVDLSKPEQVLGLIGSIEAEIGPLDVLVNNAGIGLGATVLETRPEQMRLLFEVNFFALAELCRQALTAMAPRRSGCIINVSSAAALFGWASVSSYSATKGAVHAYTQALRTEASVYGVSVSEILPISVRTKFFETAQGNQYRPSGVVITSQQVALSIVRTAAAAHPHAEVQPYYPIRLVFIINALFPSLVAGWASRRYAKSSQIPPPSQSPQQEKR